MPAPEISVCILAGHGEEVLEACLRSLRAQIAPPPFELLVGGNPSPEAVSVVRSHFPAAQVCDTGARLPGAARNPLIDRARGDLLNRVEPYVERAPAAALDEKHADTFPRSMVRGAWYAGGPADFVQVYVHPPPSTPTAVGQVGLLDRDRLI